MSNGLLHLLQNRTRFRLFLIKKLPAAFFAGLRIESASTHQCTVSVPFRWSTQNPFRSTYFACHAMAAEMSTGILAMAAVYGKKPPVSMLVLAMESRFYKKAKGTTLFTCTEGALLQQTVQQAIETGTGQSVMVQSTGVNAQGEVVAEFRITWSFKQKQNKT